MRLLGSFPSAAVALVAAGAVLLSGCSGGGTTGSGSESTSTATSTSSPSPSAASSRDVSFTVEGTTTYGTLETPAHDNGQKLAAALLIPGSGPTDRNGNQPPHDLANTLELIANELAKQGIMSLRFDKYYSGKTGAGAFAAKPDSITLQDFITQADAAYQFLSQQPAVNTGKMLVVGHSQGGLYALLTTESVTPKPVGLALMEPSDQRTLDTRVIQIDEQLNTQVAQGKITVAAARRNDALIRAAIAAFRAGNPVDLSGIEPSIQKSLGSTIDSPDNDTYARTTDRVSPPAVAAKLAQGTRVLVTDGTADTRILPRTISPLVTALRQAGTTGPGYRPLNNVDHDLFTGQATTGSSLDPQVVTALDTWAVPYATHP